MVGSLRVDLLHNPGFVVFRDYFDANTTNLRKENFLAKQGKSTLRIAKTIVAVRPREILEIPAFLLLFAGFYVVKNIFKIYRN